MNGPPHAEETDSALAARRRDVQRPRARRDQCIACADDSDEFIQSEATAKVGHVRQVQRKGTAITLCFVFGTGDKHMPTHGVQRTDQRTEVR